MKFRCKLRTSRGAKIVDQTRMVRGRLGAILFCTTALFAAAGFGQNATAADGNESLLSDYQPGQGLHVPDTGLTVGGYLTGEYVEHTAPAITVSNASLLFWWENDSRLKLFSEVDFENGLNRQGSFQSSTGQYLSLERLYADYAVSDSLTIRLGKFLTPIGRWNQIHADPLVWTTSRPLVTEVAFPTNATGLMMLGSSDLLGKSFDYALYAASGQDLDPSPNVDPFKRALGARVNVSVSDALQIGASAASFEQRSDRGQDRNLVGLDLLYQSHGYEVMSEALYRLSEHTPNGSDKGFYIQAVAPLMERLYAVYRFELFHSAGEEPGGPVLPVALLMGGQAGFGGAFIQQPGGGFGPPPPTLRLNVIGLTYRFRPSLVGKIEFVDGYHTGSLPTPVGVLSSLSVLF